MNTNPKETSGWEERFDAEFLPWANEEKSTYSKGKDGGSRYIFPSGGFARSVKSFIEKELLSTRAEAREEIIKEIQSRMPSHDAVQEYLSSIEPKK